MTELNFEQARYNMIEQQVRTWEVLDQRVLDVMTQIPRERFVPDQYRHVAYADVEIPIGSGQVMMTPKVEGRMLQALEISPTDRALEIGTGSGYVTACLARMAREVVSVEKHEQLSTRAQQLLAEMGYANVGFRIGDASSGWDADGRFDVIAVTGSIPALDPAFQRLLSVGGRLFIVVGEDPIMEALLITRTGDNDWTTESLFDTELPPLEGAATPQAFVF